MFKYRTTTSLAIFAVIPSAAAGAPIGEQYGGIAELLRRPEVLAELEVTTEQSRQISAELGQLARVQVDPRAIVRQVSELPQGERAAGYKQLVDENAARLRIHYERLMEALTPLQQERLGELALQHRIDRFGVYAVFGIGPLATELDLKIAQRGQLHEAGQKSKEELEWRIQWLRYETTNKTLKEVLTDEQFKRAQRLLGLPLSPPKGR